MEIPTHRKDDSKHDNTQTRSAGPIRKQNRANVKDNGQFKHTS